jgi:hypothetical protein
MIVHTTARKDGGGVLEGLDFLAWIGAVLRKFVGKEMNEEKGRGRMDGWMIRYEDRECPSFPCVVPYSVSSYASTKCPRSVSSYS